MFFSSSRPRADPAVNRLLLTAGSGRRGDATQIQLDSIVGGDIVDLTVMSKRASLADRLQKTDLARLTPLHGRPASERSPRPHVGARSFPPRHGRLAAVMSLIDAPTANPKYARMEYERRWLLDPKALQQLSTKRYWKLLEDRYLACGRLRLRVMTDSDTNRRLFKLTKKFPSASASARPIVTVQLTEKEHGELRALPGWDLVKTRHYLEHAGLVFSLDVFGGALDGLVTYEVEADSAERLMDAPTPPLARIEVTDDPFFWGGALCKLNGEGLRARLASLLGR